MSLLVVAGLLFLVLGSSTVTTVIGVVLVVLGARDRK